MQIEESLKLDGSPSEVWKRVSAVEDIPLYWHGTRSIAVAEKDEGGAEVKLRFAFGGRGDARVSTDEQTRTMTIEYSSGPFTGRQTVTVTDDSIVALWDIRFKGVFRLASKWNEGHFRSGTVHALERLVHGSALPGA